LDLGANFNNIQGVILDAIGKYGGLTNFEMASKWISCLVCDDDYVFQGIQFGVITQTRE
jgi:hypothetical protein